MLAKEEMPFTKYPAIVELEKRNGVSLGKRSTSARSSPTSLEIACRTIRLMSREHYVRLYLEVNSVLKTESGRWNKNL